MRIFCTVSLTLPSCIFHNTSCTRMPPTSHLFLHKLSWQIACSWQISLSTLPPYKSDQVCYHATPDAILVGFLPDMGMFFHPKSSSIKLQFFQLSSFQLRGSRTIDHFLHRPREGRSVLTHIIRRSEKLVVLAGGISICG